jgi:hypothetical protein
MDSQTSFPERYLTTRQYCKLRQIKPQTARLERKRGGGPRFIRTGNPITGRVLYRLSDVEEWLKARTYSSTAEEYVEVEQEAA